MKTVMSEADFEKMKSHVALAKRIYKMTDGYTPYDYVEFITAVTEKYEKMTGQKFFQ